MSTLPATKVSFDALALMQLPVDEEGNERHHKGQTNEYIPYLVKSFDLI